MIAPKNSKHEPKVRHAKARTDVSKNLNATPARAVGDWRRITETLQTDIIFGRIFPRERLVEDQMIERFNTSRHAVRAALEELHRRGFVDRIANKGVRVRAYTLQEVNELFELLETLQTQAIRRMPLPVAEILLEKLEIIQKSHELAGMSGNPLEVTHQNNLFHCALFNACGSVRLAEAIKDYGLMIDPIRMLRIPDHSWRKQAVEHHWAMIRALKNSDRDLLLQLCVQHLEPTKRFYLERYAHNSPKPV